MLCYHGSELGLSFAKPRPHGSGGEYSTDGDRPSRGARGAVDGTVCQCGHGCFAPMNRPASRTHLRANEEMHLFDRTQGTAFGMRIASSAIRTRLTLHISRRWITGLSWIIVMFCAVTGPLTADGLSVNVPDSVNASAGQQTTIPCTYTDDKQESIGTTPDVRWVRSFSNGSEENLLHKKTDSSQEGNWFETARATVVDQASLKIFVVSSQDAGKYTCIVGDNRATTELLVDANPRIQTELQELVLNVGETLELSCIGAGELSWDRPEHDSQYIHFTRQIDPVLGNQNVLQIQQVSTADTGAYRCFSSISGNPVETSETVYVYVTSDEEPLFVPLDQTDLVHFWDEPSVIPCRVTTPSANVTLHPQENFTSDGRAASEVTTYDSKKGFIVQAELSGYGGNVSCQAVLGNKTDVQSFTVNFAGKPHISVERPEDTILEGSMLELVCTGVEPIQWFTPSDLGNRLQISRTESLSPSQPPTYTSVLRLANALYTDTGEYGCEYQRYADLNQPQLMSSVYIFVRSADLSHFFLPASEDTIYLETNKEPFTVPCRVSNPDTSIPVRLHAFYSETNREFKGFEGMWDVTFDPKVGFQVNPTPSASPIQKLTMTCRWASSENSTFVVFKVQREGELRDVFHTDIEQSATRLVQGMGSFSLTCQVTIPIFEYGSSWSLQFKPEVEFTFPNQQDEAETNVEFEELFTPRPEGFVFGRKMTIRNVSLLNSGTYKCRIFNVERDVTLNTSLLVLADGILMMTYYPSGQGIVEVVEGQGEVCLQVLVKSFPDSTYWWTKDGVIQTNETAPRFTVKDPESKDDGLIIRGCIRNLTIEDGGNYSLIASNEYRRQKLTFQLSLLEIPQVNLTVTPSPSYPDPPLYYTEQNYSLTCLAWGNPMPRISWQWHSCQDPLCSTLAMTVDGSEWTSVDTESWANVQDEDVMASSPTARSVLSVWKPPQSGAFRCSARSPSSQVQDVAYAVKEYRLTDFQFILPAAHQFKTVYTSAPTDLICKTNIYAFVDTVIWDWTPTSNTSEPNKIAPDDERVMSQGITEFHYTSVLTIRNTSAKDTGLYRCTAQKRSTGEHVVVYEVQLNIKEITPPIFTKRLQATYSLDRKKKAIPDDFKLECEAYGDPTPTLTWYRDGRRITNRNKTVSVRTSLSRNNTRGSTLSLTGTDIASYGGTYACNVANNGGQSSSEGTILIQASPSAAIEDDVYTKNEGENLTITCKAKGEPAPEIVWMKKPRGRNEEEDVPEEMYNSHTGVLVFKELKDTDNGEYTCTARNDLGQDKDSVTLVIHKGNVFLMPLLIGGIVALVIFLMLILCLVAMAKRLCRYSRRAKRNSRNIELGLVNPRSPRVPMSPFRMSFKEEFGDQLPFDSKWEFPRDRLKLGAVIGQGAFGMVLKGVAAGINRNDRYVPVAVKTVKSDASYVDRKALFGELKMLIQVGHHLNVVNFLGACTQDSPPLVIVEFCPYGNLSDYLRSKRDSFQPVKSPKSEQEENTENELNYADLLLRETCVSEPPAAEYELVDKEAKRMAEKSLTVEDLVCFCFQVARGMEFLASRKCIHRDLAARNVLLGENNVVKICDFGLSRSFYHDSDYIGSGKGLLPIKWMAPEAIFDKVFTTYSDIWSFGVFAWEVFSLGGSPYPGIQVDERFYDKMKSGYRMSCPEHAPREVYQMMLECWSDEAKDRPMFSELAEQFGEQLESNTRQEYIDLNIPYQEGQYCELDFSKTQKKPETVPEEAENAQSSSDDKTAPNAATDHFDDPLYHRGPRTKESVRADETMPTQSCQPQLQAEEGSSPTPTTEIVGETCPRQRYAAIAEASSQDSQSSAKTEVQLLDSLPEDPYQRGTDEQLHTYTSVKGTRPGLNADNTQASGIVRNPNETSTNSLSSPDDDNKIHTYSSIKGPHSARTPSEQSPTDPSRDLDRNHLYSSIKGSRPDQSQDITPDVKSQDQGLSDSPEERSSLLGTPTLPERDFQSMSLARLPDGRFRLQKPPLPRRDFSTASWSPERETLLSSPETPDPDVPIQPVYV